MVHKWKGSVSGITKRDEVVDAFRKETFELLALTEMKIKKNGEISWCRVSDICGGRQENKKGRENVAALLRDRYIAVVEFWCVKSLLL